ncbi:CCCH-type zinc finger transcription factor [Mucor lusitanicus]|uniref:CCCH-type zinc finger transcription factor n=2 Tax=Mucor circinelloides f. lusitanicus TaxID=29924 RepID=A0A168P9Z3_MUCCL|nr:CCCH-type zinc finger transcription factor [Mucor lusitanicus CBS 277.49]
MPSEITYKDIILYKTECCRNWEEKGHCRYGKRCRYAHGREELRPILRSNQYKTKICKAYHDNGSCSYGIRCTFIHQMNATDRNHYNLIPLISPTSSNASFQSTTSTTTHPPLPPHQHQMNTRCQPLHHSESDLNTNMFISKNIMEDIIDLSSYEPSTGH